MFQRGVVVFADVDAGGRRCSRVVFSRTGSNELNLALRLGVLQDLVVKLMERALFQSHKPLTTEASIDIHKFTIQ